MTRVKRSPKWALWLLLVLGVATIPSRGEVMRYVDPAGNDNNPGSQDAPWQTINHGVAHIAPGETLVINGGTYHEQVMISRIGRADAPITIRAATGANVIIDGGFAEFTQRPNDAWEAVPGGGPEEYRSTKAYPNIADVIGCFADARIGLQTYWHQQDLLARSELWVDKRADGHSNLDPVYCGPGLLYDRNSGHIHVRLSHTNLPKPYENYRGKTDPRKLALVIAPMRAVPLTLHHAAHVTIADLVIRGGGYDTIKLQQAQHIQFRNVSVRCGTYGLRAMGTMDLTLDGCGFYGNIPPWGFRTENSLRSRRPGWRDVARLTGHALIVAETGREFSVFAFPMNDRWEIKNCEFTDCHDGLYLGGIGIDFHHNVVENMHDDGIYLSPMYPHAKGEIRIRENIFRRCLTTLAFGASDTPHDDIYIYRNIIDLRQPINYNRPNKAGAAKLSYGIVMGDHGSPIWPAMKIYQNTFIQPTARDAAMATLNAQNDRPRYVYNNIFLHLGRLPGYRPPLAKLGTCEDGNIYWGQQANPELFSRFRGSATFAETKAYYKPGCSQNSQVADPQLQLTDMVLDSSYEVAPGPAHGTGIVLPASWPDSARPADGQRPDVGARQRNAAPLVAGRHQGSLR